MVEQDGEVWGDLAQRSTGDKRQQEGNIRGAVGTSQNDSNVISLE